MIKNKTSYLNFYKCLASLALIDGVFSSKESQMIDEILDHARLDISEKAEVRAVLEKRSDPYTFIDLISEPSHLSQLHHLANILFKKDDFDVKEKAFIKDFNKYLESKFDPQAGMRKMEDYLKEDQLKRDEEFNQAKGIFLNLVEFFRK